MRSKLNFSIGLLVLAFLFALWASWRLRALYLPQNIAQAQALAGGMLTLTLIFLAGCLVYGAVYERVMWRIKVEHPLWEALKVLAEVDSHTASCDKCAQGWMASSKFQRSYRALQKTHFDRSVRAHGGTIKWLEFDSETSAPELIAEAR